MVKKKQIIPEQFAITFRLFRILLHEHMFPEYI